MEYINFTPEGNKVPKVVLGLMRINEKQPEEVTELINTALDNGINMLDIADIYGNGACEEILGKAFKQNSGLREKFFVQSKCGINKKGTSFDGNRFTFYDFSKEHILASVDGILKRLNTDHIDMLLLHRPDVLMEPDEVAEAFQTLHDAGKVQNFGVSNQNPTQMALLQSALPFPILANQLQLSCAFTPMLDSGFNVNMEIDPAIVREGGVLEYCRLHGVAVQSWSSMQYGFFEGVFIGSDKYPKLNATLNALAEKYAASTGKQITPTVVALAWILRLPAQMQAVIGTTRQERVAEAALATEVHLTRQEWYEVYLSAGNKLP